MIARPTPASTQTSTKSAVPCAAPDWASATAARFTSFSKTTGVCRSSRSAASRPLCQRGRLNAKVMSPVPGSTRPGVPSTIRRTLDSSAPALLAAWTTALCTTPTGSSVSFVDCSTRPTTAPVMSAQAATTRSAPTSTPTTYALLGRTA
ncbi:hypothetical protein B0E53_05120 [Micromonospora sp. MH33]|nr:hypothetical protein B0E53_05120 [Micromonospora sp. MH33]